MKNLPHRPGISLLELLVVVSIVVFLMGLMVSAVQGARASATRLSCANNLKQIGLATHAYENTNGHFPRAMDLVGFRNRQTPWGWTLTLLPYLDCESLFYQARVAIQTDWNTTHNPPHAGLSTVVSFYACPGDGRLVQPITDDLSLTAAYGSYWGISTSALLFEPFPEGGGRFRDPQDGAMPLTGKVGFNQILDGTSSTLLIGEKIPAARYLSGNWYSMGKDSGIPGEGGISSTVMFSEKHQAPNCQGPIRYGPSQLKNECDTWHFGSLHSGGSNFLLCDGSVRFIGYSAAPIMPALSSRAGGEIVEIP